MDAQQEIKPTTLEEKSAAIAKLLSEEPELYEHFVKIQAMASQVDHIQKAYDERVDAVFKVGIRLVMTASNRKNLVITDEDSERAEQAVLSVSEVNGNVRYSLK